MSAMTGTALRRRHARELGAVIGRAVFNIALTGVVLLVLWELFIKFSGASPYVVKGPKEVWDFLFVDNPRFVDAATGVIDPDKSAAANRSEIWHLTWQTLKDASLGFGVGLVIATVVAMIFTLSKAVEAGVMPLALLLRSVPLVSIAPVIILICGRGSLSSVAVIGTIVVLFPAMASVMYGLRQAPRQTLDVIHVYGGGNATALAKVAVPAALPSIFAAARVSAPGAVTGALLGEWLSTGKGIGGAINRFTATAQFDDLWAAVAVITVISLALYNVVQMVENVVLEQMGMFETRA